MDSLFQSTALFFVLLNPFLMSIFLIDLIQDFSLRSFITILTQGTIISCCVFILFAILGDAIFKDVLQARFASFLIFGGIIFLVIGIRFVFGGSDALRSLRGGDIDEAAAKVAMPYMIGPGTVSASIFTGSHLTPPWAILAILIALLLTFVGIILFKIVHDDVKKRDEKLVERYIDIVGRVMSLVIGTFALEMIIQGIEILLTDWGFIT